MIHERGVAAPNPILQLFERNQRNLRDLLRIECEAVDVDFTPYQEKFMDFPVDVGAAVQSLFGSNGSGGAKLGRRDGESDFFTALTHRGFNGPLAGR